MDDVTRHPDDATLFDLVEEALEPARAEQVRSHLSRCSACAAFVQAARAGAPVTNSAVEAMPLEAAANLHAAVTTAWRERVAGIAAAEATQDAIETTPVPAPSPAGEFAGYAPADRTGARETSASVPPPRRRGRRLVPVLAFVVLGALAGTSVLIGDESRQQATIDRDPGSAETANSPTAGSAPEATDIQDPAIAPSTAPDEMSGGDDSNEVGGGAPAPAAGGEATVGAPDPSVPGAESAKADRAGDATSAGDTAATAVPPPADYEAFVDHDRICIVTFDETQLALPDGRIPMQITQGPFGLYLVCG